MKKVIILGGTGFLGKNLTKHFLNAGFEVVSIGQKQIGNAESIVNCIKSSPPVHFLSGGIDALKTFPEHIVDSTLVMAHSSAFPSQSNINPISDISDNLLLNVEVIQTALKYKVKKILFASSGGAVYGLTAKDMIEEEHPTKPQSSYGIVKLATENYLRLLCEKEEVPFCSLRISNIYGPDQKYIKGKGLITNLIHNAKTGNSISIFGNGATVRDYIYIDDVSSAFVKATNSNTLPEALNIGSGQGISILKLVALIEKKLNSKIPLEFFPANSSDPAINILNIEKAKRYLEWSPIFSLEEGLKKTIT